MTCSQKRTPGLHPTFATPPSRRSVNVSRKERPISHLPRHPGKLALYAAMVLKLLTLNSGQQNAISSFRLGSNNPRPTKCSYEKMI